jgi:hypothetical protein
MPPRLQSRGASLLLLLPDDVLVQVAGFLGCPHSLTRLPQVSCPHSLTHSLTHSFIQPRSTHHTHTHTHTHTLNCSISHSLTHSLTHSLMKCTPIYTLIPAVCPLARSLTHSLTRRCAHSGGLGFPPTLPCGYASSLSCNSTLLTPLLRHSHEHTVLLVHV